MFMISILFLFFSVNVVQTVVVLNCGNRDTKRKSKRIAFI